MGEAQVRITSAGELLAGLRHPEPAHRASLLRAIRSDPRAAAAFGPHEGRDLVDELLALCEETRGKPERWEYVFTALSLEDERTTALAKREFLATHDPRSLVAAARRLSRLPEEEKVGFFGPVVLEARDTNRCRLGANVLAGSDLEDPRLAIRVAALTDRDHAVPPLDARTLDAWLAELHGPHPRTTRDLLLRSGEGALATLLSFWPRLTDAVRIWALQLGAEAEPTGYASLVRRTVRRETHKDVLLTALGCLRRLPPEPRDEAIIAPLHAHADPTIRAAAIRAGRGEIDGTDLLRDDPPEEVRLAVVDRLEGSGRARDIALLASLLADGSWRVRARAAEALVEAAPASLPALRETLTSAHEGARVAAARALLSLGEEQCIADALL